MKPRKKPPCPPIRHSKLAIRNLEAHICGKNTAAAHILETLFTACGWKVVDHTRKQKPKPRSPRKQSTRHSSLETRHSKLS